MNRTELIDLVNKIKLAEGSEEEIDDMIDVFVNSVSDPKAIDYIFEKKFENLSSEEIVDKALSYKPINL